MTGDTSSLSLERPIAAPPATVYEALTTVAAITKWFAPGEAVTVPAAECDARPDGRWRVVMQDPTGVLHRVGGNYSVVDPGRRLVFTWAWEADPGRKSEVEITLQPSGEGTLLRLVHGGFTEEADRDRHAKGWSGTLERLDRYATGQPMTFC